MEECQDVGQISLELCSCGICDRPTRAPKCLPCMHTFCKSCLGDHIREELEADQNGKKYFQCPKCGVNTPVPADASGNYADSFNDDSFVNKLTEVISIYSVDKSCDICERGDIESEAVCWCYDCYDSLCTRCKIGHHHGRATSHHLVKTFDELRNLRLEDIMKQKHTTPCSTHDNYFLNLYCDKCKVIICSQCVTSLHTKCDLFISVNDAMTFHQDELGKVLDQVKDLEINQDSPTKDAMDVLQESISTSANNIKSIAAALREKINQSEQELLLQLETSGEELKKKISLHPNSKINHKSLLKSQSDRLQSLLTYGNDVEILETFNCVRKSICSMNCDNNEELPMIKINFVEDSMSKVFERDFKTLGEVEVEDCKIDVGISSWGVTCTSRDEIIVVDCRNKRVQKFSIEGNLIDHIQISEEPRDVTCTGRNEVAITIMKKFIFFVATTNDMRLRRKVKTDKQYDSISMSNLLDSLLVSCIEEKSVDIIDIEGAILKTFNADASGLQLFQEPRYVTLAKGGNLYVTDVAQGCIKGISADGRLVFEYKPDGAHVLRHPQDLCIDNIGNIFIVDYSNSRIHLITSDGQFQRFILGRDSGLVRPVAIHITPNNKLIIVQSDGVVKLFTYE